MHTFQHANIDLNIPKLKQVNENGVRYYLTPQGNRYPSVTTVLSEYSREAIQSWRRRVGYEQANKITQQASTRGTRVHKLCENYLDNQPVKFNTPIEQELFLSIKPLLHRIDKIYVQELRMYSDHLRMAGTVDCVGQFDGRLSVIDFKTSSKLKEKQYIENYLMQCSAYAIMFEEQFGIPVPRIVVIIAVEGQEPQLFLERRDNYVAGLKYFRDLYEKKHGFSIAHSL